MEEGRRNVTGYVDPSGIPLSVLFNLIILRVMSKNILITHLETKLDFLLTAENILT